MRLRYNQNCRWCGWEGNQNFLNVRRNKLVACLLARLPITRAHIATTLISKLKRFSVVNSHWLYPSLMTHMLNKLLNLVEKGKYLLAPCQYPVQASQLSMSRFILIEINIHEK